MGVGKSAVGSCLKEKTGLDQFETDELVESKLKLSIPEIFSKHGEKRFREAEAEALQSITAHKQAIVVTGGGIVLREENVGLLKRLGTIVWLDADEETLFERASRKGDRPLLQAEDPRKTFSQMLQARRPVYAKIANIRVDTSRLTADEVAVKILMLVAPQ